MFAGVCSLACVCVCVSLSLGEEEKEIAAAVSGVRFLGRHAKGPAGLVGDRLRDLLGWDGLSGYVCLRYAATPLSRLDSRRPHRAGQLGHVHPTNGSQHKPRLSRRTLVVNHITVLLAHIIPNSDPKHTMVDAIDWTRLKKGEVDLGTSIMAVAYDKGVIIGADSRTTMGSYIANRVTDKLTHLSDRIYCCRSGSAADTQALADIVTYYLDLYGVTMEEQPDVKIAANLFQEMVYQNKDRLSAGIIVAGWDKKNGGKVFNIPLGGGVFEQPWAIGGTSIVLSFFPLLGWVGSTHTLCSFRIWLYLHLWLLRRNLEGWLGQGTDHRVCQEW